MAIIGNGFQVIDSFHVVTLYFSLTYFMCGAVPQHDYNMDAVATHSYKLDRQWQWALPGLCGGEEITSDDTVTRCGDQWRRGDLPNWMKRSSSYYLLRAMMRIAAAMTYFTNPMRIATWWLQHRGFWISSKSCPRREVDTPC